METTNITAFVNNYPVEVGCYIDSHHGQYGPDMVTDLFTSLVRPLDEHESPKEWRILAEAAREAGNEENLCNAWEMFYDSSERLVEMLNDATEDGFVWAWIDGDFMLASVEDLD
jgi:hypothetical protein